MTAKLLERRPVVEYREGPEGERGPRGPQGDRGPQGLPGRDGKDGRDGIDGRNGRDGRDAQEEPEVDSRIEIKRLPDKRIDYAVIRSELGKVAVLKANYGPDGYLASADLQHAGTLET